MSVVSTTAPSVTTKGYSKITATSAELSGEVEDDNGEPISERGFVWLKGSGIPMKVAGISLPRALSGAEERILPLLFLQRPTKVPE